MIIIAHRVNSIKDLKKLPPACGAEVDVRHSDKTGRLYLNHDIGGGGDLEEYLKNFRHRFIIFNIKEADTEQQCLDLAEKYHIPKDNYFLLDVEFPYLYSATRAKQIKEIAVRYSEAEPIQTALAQKGFCNWVWIDTNTRLPLDASVIKKLRGFKTCLVSPDRWGRPQDIKTYRKKMQALGFQPDAVMARLEYIDLWK